MNREKLQTAVDEGIISDAQAIKLAAHFSEAPPEDLPVQDESLRFLANLNDVFLSIGIIILFAGLAIGLGISGFGSIASEHFFPVLGAIIAAAAWGMAEYFTARRKLLLPSIVLSTIFTGACASIAASFMGWTAFNENAGALAEGFQNLDTAAGRAENSVITIALVSGLATAVAAFVFYLRFRLPFSLFLIAGAALAVGLIVSFGFFTLIITGALTLIAAIAFDARDPKRLTRLSDNGFWLHVAAAPQLFYGIKGFFELESSAGGSMVLIGLVIVLAFLSLLLNRRALLLSGLFSLGIAVFTLFGQFGDSIVVRFAGPLLLLGAVIVLLGGGWHTARGALLKLFPSTGLWGRIFPPESPKHV